jgi:DNA-binding response OmpR family regulator
MAKILITEDEAMIALDLKFILIEQGHQVIGIAANAEEFHRLFQLHQPEVIFMDVNLQGKIDGMTIAQQVREQSDIPIVFCSAFSQSSFSAIISGLGRSGYINKPFSEQAVAGAIKQVL